MNTLKRIKHDKRLKRYFAVLLLSSLALGFLIVPIEKGGQINSLSDGLWWVVSTVTGVGYGQMVPVTIIGRVIGAILMTAGVMLFSLIVVILSARVIHREEKYWGKRMKRDLESMNNKLYRLEKKLDYVIKDGVKRK